jgi:chromosome segregation ATPase
MWPKMLLELLPHFARLMPMADKYLATRSASDKAQQAALSALAAEVRGELGQVTEAHTGLRRQLQEQNTQIAELGVEVTRGRLGVESVEARVLKLEKTAGAAMRVLWVVVGLLVMVAALLAVVVVRAVR